MHAQAKAHPQPAEFVVMVVSMHAVTAAMRMVVIVTMVMSMRGEDRQTVLGGEIECCLGDGCSGAVLVEVKGAEHAKHDQQARHHGQH